MSKLVSNMKTQKILEQLKEDDDERDSEEYKKADKP